MHVAERQSIPNLPVAPGDAAGLPHTIAFDSLKSLPERDYLQPHYQSQQQPPGLMPLCHPCVCRGCGCVSPVLAMCVCRNWNVTSNTVSFAWRSCCLHCLLHFGKCICSKVNICVGEVLKTNMRYCADSGLNLEVVKAITEELRERLGLTLFGYDTIVQEGTGSIPFCLVRH